MDPPDSPDYFSSLDDLPDESALSQLSPLKLGPQKMGGKIRAESQSENRPGVFDNDPDVTSSDNSQPPPDAVSQTNFVHYSALNPHQQGPSIGHSDNLVFPSVTFVQEPKRPGRPRKLVDPSVPTAPKNPVGRPRTSTAPYNARASKSNSCTS
ncbi:hypothetical protein C8J57DRAFT_1236490 [Mycena rebaudengoi]|nr:hypothetical protein C8J57DRAFT_1236490 [Mycena rebaudengoi]